jgi:PhnB protein
MTSPIPEGFRSITPSLVVHDGAAAIDFYRRAFDAELLRRLDAGDNVMYAEVRIGDSIVTLNDEMPEYGFRAPDSDGPVSASLLIYCEDADALHAHAVDAGATVINPVSDQFHGDRAGSVRDPFGHRWAIATHTEDMSEEEMQRRMDAWMAGSTAG